ncbi:hypothetical protein AAG906_012043 [Vitis piasezkii]
MANVAATNITFFKPFCSITPIFLPHFQHHHPHSQSLPETYQHKVSLRCHLSVTPEPSQAPQKPSLPGSPLTSRGRAVTSLWKPWNVKDGYARASGRPGVCLTSSGPGATNIISGIADANFDSIPIVAITGQVPRGLMGTDAFQEVPLIDITRPITKFNYLVLDVEDIPRTVKEAFLLATSGRPGPVLIDIPRDIQKELVVPNWNKPIMLPGNASRLPKLPEKAHLEEIVRLISVSKRPVVYAGGGKVEAFARNATIVHIDIDPAEIGKNKKPHLSICTDVKLALEGINTILEKNAAKQPTAENKRGKGTKFNDNVSAWIEEIDEQKEKYPASYRTFGEAIPPQYAIQLLDELTNGNAIICTGVGQHQMWAAQYCKHKNPATGSIQVD